MKFFQSSGAHKQFAPSQNYWKKLSRRIKKGRAADFGNSNSPILMRNPYYHNRSAGKNPSRRLTAILVVLFLLIIAWVSVLIFLPYFRVLSVTYTGLKVIKKEEIDQNLKTEINPRSWWPRNNYFIIRAGSLEKHLMKSFSLNTVKVTKIFPNSLRVDLEEKFSTIIYDNGREYILLDQNGLVLKKLMSVAPEEVVSLPTSTYNLINNTSSTPNTTGGSLALSSSTTSTAVNAFFANNTLVHVPNYKKITTEYGPFPILYDTRALESSSSSPVITPALVNGIISFYTQIDKQGIAKVKYLILDNPLAGLAAKTNQAWDVYFSPTKDISSQLNNLRIILKTNRPTSYVDLRYGDRVYWK